MALSSKTLFVRNLPYSTTDAQLEQTFSRHGALKACFTVKGKGQKRVNLQKFVRRMSLATPAKLLLVYVIHYLNTLVVLCYTSGYIV